MLVRMWLTCRCTRMPINSHARFTLFLTAISVVNGIWAILRAISSTVSSRSSRATTLLSSPQSRACCADSVGASSNQSMVRCQFIISQGSIMVCPPGSPRLWARGIWKYASSEATQKSVSKPR